MKKSEGDGRRVQRVEKEVLGLVSRFLMGTFKGDLPGIVSVSRVAMAPDLRQARIAVTIIGGKPEDHDLAAEMLQERAGEIQRYLADNLPMRFTPKLNFVADHGLEKVLKIDRLLHDLSMNRTPKVVDEEDEDGSDD